MRNDVPEDATPNAADYRPDKAAWSSVEMLLAAVKDEIVLSRMVALAAAGATPPAFEPTPRPGIAPKAPTGSKRLTHEQRRAIDPRLRSQPKEH